MTAAFFALCVVVFLCLYLNELAQHQATKDDLIRKQTVLKLAAESVAYVGAKNLKLEEDAKMLRLQLALQRQRNDQAWLNTGAMRLH